MKFKRAEKEIDPDIVICFAGPESFLARFLSSKRKLIRFRGRDDDVGKSISSSLFNEYVDKYLFPCDLIAISSGLSDKSYKKIYLDVMKINLNLRKLTIKVDLVF